MGGYIKIPRDLFASAEWLATRVFGKVDAQLDLLQLATYTEERIIRCKSGDVTLRRGQLLTTMRALADRWGWSAASVHRFLSSLREVREGCIRVLIETTPTDGKTLITIVDYDRWEYEDETRFETQNETTTETADETRNETPKNSEKSLKSMDFSCEKTNRETMAETQNETTTETADETRNETQSELKYSNTVIESKDSNTHTVDSFKGGSRGETPKYSQAEVDESLSLMRWISTEHPTLFNHYKSSINPRVLCDILAEYKRNDVEYIIRSMSFKRAFSPNTPFFHTFENFVRNAPSVQSKSSMAPKSARYSYNEVCDMVGRGIPMEQFRSVRDISGKVIYWEKQADVAC